MRRAGSCRRRLAWRGDFASTPLSRKLGCLTLCRCCCCKVLAERLGKGVERLVVSFLSQLMESAQQLETLVLQQIEVNNRISRQHTVVTFRAGDQRGLLYRLTSALVDAGLDIMVAKVTTWRGAAEDAFYVVSRETGKRLDNADAERLRERLAANLGGAPASVGPS